MGKVVIQPSEMIFKTSDWLQNKYIQHIKHTEEAAIKSNLSQRSLLDILGENKKI